MAKKMLVLSIDALFTRDLDYLKTLPNLGKLIRDGSVVNDMVSIYPSLTFPAHTSISTGCYPDRHGVIHNGRDIVGQKKFAWVWYADQIKCPTLLEKAMERGYTTASVIWPVSGNAKADYVIPDIWPLNVEDDPVPLFTESGSANIIDSVFKKNLDKWDWNFHPGYDRFGVACAADIIKAYQPDIMLLHICPVDDQRHHAGIDSPEAKAALKECDDEMAVVFDAYKEMGLFDELDFVLLGDHGQMNVERVFAPNLLFREEGLLQCDADGRATSWKAYVRSCDFSAQVFLKDQNDKMLYDLVYKQLCDWRDNHDYGVERVMTHDECAAEWHVTGDYTFVIESDGKTEFINPAIGRPLINKGEEDYHFALGSHGHMPTKGDKPPFLVSGPSFRRGVVVEGGKIVDIAPTLAKAYGIDLPDTDGQPISELIK